MIRFADIAPEAKPKKTTQPTVEAKPATAIPDTTKPKAPRKPKKSA